MQEKLSLYANKRRKISTSKQKNSYLQLKKSCKKNYKFFSALAMDTVYPQPIRLCLDTSSRRKRGSQNRYRTQPVTFSEIKVSPFHHFPRKLRLMLLFSLGSRRRKRRHRRTRHISSNVRRICTSPQ